MTAYGYRGQHLQIAVPDDIRTALDGSFFDCTDGRLASWFSSIHDGGDQPSSAYEAGHTEDFWILDVDGRRLVISAMTYAGAPAEDADELAAIVDSIRIEP